MRIRVKASWCKIILNKIWRFSSNETLIRVKQNTTKYLINLRFDLHFL